jgi:hypothetical protein
MTKNDEIFVSVDVEADGPIPGPHSMLSFGAVSFQVKTGGNWNRFWDFSANLDTLPGASGDPKTMEWWSKRPEAWAKARADARPPEEVMKDFTEWLESLPGKPVFVGWPATWDFMFIFWYLIKFTGKSPFSHSGLCLKSIASDRLGLPFRNTGKRNLPKEWFAGCPKHNHEALTDAEEQGILWMNMLLQKGQP